MSPTLTYMKQIRKSFQLSIWPLTIIRNTTGTPDSHQKGCCIFFIDHHTLAPYTTVSLQIKSEMHVRTSEKVVPSVFEVSEDDRNGPKAEINLCPMLPLWCVTMPPPPVSLQIKSRMHQMTSWMIVPSVFEVPEDHENGPEAPINFCIMLSLWCVTYIDLHETNQDVIPAINMTSPHHQKHHWNTRQPSARFLYFFSLTAIPLPHTPQYRFKLNQRCMQKHQKRLSLVFLRSLKMIGMVPKFK